MGRKLLLLWLALCLGLVLIQSSCNLPLPENNSLDAPPPTAQDQSSDQPPDQSPDLSDEPEIPANDLICPDQLDHRVQFRITTTSDWTSLRLLSGGQWCRVELLSSSEEADTAGFEDNALSIVQDTSRAFRRDSVELVAEGYLAYLDPEQPLIFEIERGNLGSTQVEVFHLVGESFSPVTTFTWGRIKQHGRNAQEYEVSPQPFLGTTPNEYIVIAQLNFWYYGEGNTGGFENPDGSRQTPFTPYYGETYWGEDPDWVYQQIEWAVEYGVDAFSIEWDGPEQESLGIPMEPTIDNVFLVSPNIHKIRWAIFYDFPLRTHYLEALGLDMSQALNFNQQIAYDTFVDDFIHFATKYFQHPQYLTIDGRPVVYIWATHAFTGDFAGAMDEARQAVADLGYDVFIVGDEVCYGCFNQAHAALFDGSTTFTFLIPGVDQPSLENVGQAAETTDTAFTWWRSRIADLQVTGRDDTVNFQPAWAPQYDESWIKEFSNPTVVLAESRDQVVQMAEVARKHAEPAGEEGLQLIWVNTWNCWGEGTTVEPTIVEENGYPGGNYGFDFLEIIREVYGEETYYTSP